MIIEMYIKAGINFSAILCGRCSSVTTHEHNTDDVIVGTRPLVGTYAF
jgi:hypothetical protein